MALLHRRYNRLSDGPITPDLLDLAFVMIDLDHFKTINDSAGHAAGDIVLRQLRDLLVSCSRTSDIIVRWGGDEFLLVARDLSGDGLLELAERVRSARRPARLRDRRGPRGPDHAAPSASPATRSSASSSTP